MCFHPEFVPLPELVEEMVAESELVVFDEAGFSIQWALTEEKARLQRRASLTKSDIDRELLRARYLLWLQFWMLWLKRSHKNKRGRELERQRKAAEAEAEATGGSVLSPGPKPPKRLFETGAASMAARSQTGPGTSDLQRELDGVRGQSMVRCSDKVTRTKSLTHLARRDDVAAAESDMEGEAVQKALFSEEAEVSRHREQRRRELVSQHKNPQKPMPLMEVTMNVHPEKWSKSLHRLANCSEMAE